jgi:hypothetical protein
LFSQIASADASLLALDDAVRPFVDVARIAALPSLQRPEAFTAHDWEPRLFVAVLQAWMGPRRGRMGHTA